MSDTAQMSGAVPAATPSLSPREEEILAGIDEAEIIELTAELVGAVSENPPGGEAACAAVLVGALRRRGLQARTRPVAPGRPNVVGLLRAGGDGPGLLLLSHLDTVPAGNGWTGSPFEVRRQSGRQEGHHEERLIGRGVADTKGGIAAATVAMGVLAAHRAELAGPLILAAVADEEENSIGARQLAPDLTGHSLRGAIVIEPTELQTVVAARGDCYLTVELAGRAAHSGNPSAGANAIYGAMSVVRAVQAMHAAAAGDPHPLLGPATWSVGQVAGGTGTSIVPASCRLSIDRRLLPGETAAAAAHQLQAAIAAADLPDGVSASVAVAMEMPGFETPPTDPVVSVTRVASVDAGAPDLPVAGWTAACDGGFLSRDHHLPTVVFGPGSVAEQAHQANESVPVAELVIAARAYTLAALRLGAARAEDPSQA